MIRTNHTIRSEVYILITTKYTTGLQSSDSNQAYNRIRTKKTFGLESSIQSDYTIGINYCQYYGIVMMNRYMKQYKHMMDETWDGLEKNLNKK